MSSVSPSAKMKSEFGWLIAVAMVGMTAITLFLCALQYHRERIATLEMLESSAGERVFALDALLAAAVRPVTTLRQATQEQNPEAVGETTASLLARLAPAPSTLSFESALGAASPILSAARPESNPERRPVWSPVYQSPAYQSRGAGAVMVRYAEPAYRDDQFLGVATAEIALTFLHRVIEMPDLVGQRLVLVDRSRHVVADSWLGSSHGRDVTLALGEVLPASLVPDQAITTATPTQIVAHGYTVLVAPLSAAPWLVVVLIPEGALFLRILPWLGIAAVLIAGLFAILTLSQVYLSRRFIRPAQALVRLVTAEASGQILPPQRIPSLWQPWFSRVTGAFAASHAQIAEAEAFRNQIARVLRGEEAQLIETQCPGLGATPRRIAWTLTAGTTESGAITHIIATGNEVPSL